MASKIRFTRRLYFFFTALLLVFGAVAATSYTLWRLRSATMERNFDAASQFARTFEMHLAHTFDGIDIILSNASGDMTAESKLQRALADALRRAPYLRSLSVLDTRDIVIVSSDPRNVGMRVAGRDFLPAVDASNDGLRIGTPWSGHDFYDGRVATSVDPAAPVASSLVPVLRRIGGGSGGAAVSIVAAVNTDYFLNYYAKSIDPHFGVVELLRYDGMVMLSTDAERRPGTRLEAAPLMERIASDVPGQFEYQRENGHPVLTAYRSSRNYPFAVVVHLDKEMSLESWRHERLQTLGVVSVVLLGALVFAGMYFLRLERVAREHEADLAKLRLRGAALEAAANSIIITDNRGTIEWVNPAFCQLSGYGMGEVLGRTPRALVHSGVQDPATYQDLWRTILAGYVWHGEIVNRRKDGSQYTEDQTITPVRDANGVVSHFIAIKQDVTDRKQVEQALREQIRFAQALNVIAQSIATYSNSPSILKDAVEVVGRDLAVDRALIYNVSFESMQAVALCEWRDLVLTTTPSTRDSYPLPLFLGGAQHMRDTRQWIASHADAVAPQLTGPAADLLHRRVGVQSLLWFPFDFRDDGYHLLVLSQHHAKRAWRTKEFEFLGAVCQQISIALATIQMSDARRKGEERMAELSRHLVVVQESARRRLSGELHDRTSPNLASIGVHLNIITADLQEENLAVLEERLADVRALIEDTTASIREICSDLRPPVLDYSGLQAALQHYVSQFRRRTNMVVHLACDQAGGRLAPALESALFRIVQEALTNCSKHSRAESIAVELGLDGEHVSLTVSDDGVGFDPSALGNTTHTSGLGLLLMKEMAEFSGGKFTLESTPGMGTRITVEMHTAHDPT